MAEFARAALIGLAGMALAGSLPARAASNRSALTSHVLVKPREDRLMRILVVLMIFSLTLSLLLNGNSNAAMAQGNAPGIPPGLARLAALWTIPLPHDLRIVPPDQDALMEYAGFSGAWFGRWEGQVPTIVVVERMIAAPLHATVVYSTNQPGCAGCTITPIPIRGWRGRGSLGDGYLLLDPLPDGSEVSFRLIQEDRLDGRYEARGAIMRIPVFGSFIKVKD